MKKGTTCQDVIGLLLLVLVYVMVGMGVMGKIIYNNNQSHQAEINAWRQAASPIFQSRGIVDITDRATPRDLENYLNPAHAVVWQERANYLTYPVNKTTGKPYGKIFVHSTVY